MSNNWTPEEVAERNRKVLQRGDQKRLDGYNQIRELLYAPGPANPSLQQAAYQHVVGPVRKSRAHPERDLEKACSDLLQLDGWRLLKTDPGSDASVIRAIRLAIMGCPALNHLRELIFSLLKRCGRGKGFGEIGMADCLYIRYDYTPDLAISHVLGKATPRQNAQVLWIEWKAPRGKPSPHQRAWIAAERARGALVLLAGEDFKSSVDGFLEHYRASGLMRQKL